MSGLSHRRVEVSDGAGFDVRTHRAGTGPRVVVLGGVHGDETEGVLAAGRLGTEPLDLAMGTVDVVPICHEAAFLTDSRTSPVDGGNLARVFPGDPDGSPTESLAHALFTEVLSGCDLLIDLHTSGREYDMPVLAGYPGGPTEPMGLSGRAARAFGGSFLWRHPTRSAGRTLSVVDHGMYVEGPGGGATDPELVDHYVLGVRRVLAMMDMVEDVVPYPDQPIRVTGGGNLDQDMISVQHAGLFLREAAVGDFVPVGQRLGSVVDTSGQQLESVVAPRSGYVMAMKARSSVAAGDLVLCLAEPDDGA